MLYLLVILAFSAGELFAQSTSSASQVVAFGVRRIALVPTPSASFVSNTTSRSSLKITAGAQSQVQDVVEPNLKTADQIFSTTVPSTHAGVVHQVSARTSRESDLNNARSSSPKAIPSDKLFVTYTE